MIKKYTDMMKEYRTIRNQIKVNTQTMFKDKIKLIEMQEKLLLEYAVNCHQWVPENNNNQFFFLINLYNDAIQSGRRIKELILEGDYNAAGTLLRNIFETMLLVEHLRKDANNWQEWLEYQRLEEDERETPLRKKSTKLKQLRSKFAITQLINNSNDSSVEDNYKWTYGYFCSCSHTSMERLRRRTVGVRDVGFKIYYAPVFNEKLTKYYLNTLFTMIDTIHTDFNSAFKPIKLPSILKKYDQVKELFKE